MDIGEDNPHEILATTVVAFALSSILTGAKQNDVFPVRVSHV